jgi:hypothetical protein
MGGGLAVGDLRLLPFGGHGFQFILGARAGVEADSLPDFPTGAAPQTPGSRIGVRLTAASSLR